MGPLLFVIAAMVVVVGLAIPLALGTLAGMAEERDGLLRNPMVRELVRAQLGGAADRAAAPTAEGRNFVVAEGATARQVASQLAAEGIITRPLVFLLPLYQSGREDSLQAGTYRVSAAMRPSELGRLFQRAVGEQLVLRILEGWRLTEISAEVGRSFPRISAEQFAAAAAVAGDYDYAFLRDLEPGTPLEGFLFPETYFFSTDVSAQEVVRTLLDTFRARAGDVVMRAAEERGMTPQEIVTIASIVEREAQARHESATIASVFWNRVEIGMKLDADPTIQYAIGEWRELTLADLEIDSPYNTYLVAGLPPTPICSPGEAALRAAAEPEETEFFYFVAKGDGTGEHAFARTLEEHEQNRVIYGNR